MGGWFALLQEADESVLEVRYLHREVAGDRAGTNERGAHVGDARAVTGHGDLAGVEGDVVHAIEIDEVKTPGGVLGEREPDRGSSPVTVDQLDGCASIQDAAGAHRDHA